METSKVIDRMECNVVSYGHKWAKGTNWFELSAYYNLVILKNLQQRIVEVSACIKRPHVVRNIHE